MNYQNYQNLKLLSSSDTRGTLMHLFLFTNTAQRELYAENTQQQLTLLALLPCSKRSIYSPYIIYVYSKGTI